MNASRLPKYLPIPEYDAVLFSRRYSSETLQGLSLQQRLRVRLYIILNEYSQHGQFGENLTFDRAEYQYKKELGLEFIEAFQPGTNNVREPSNFEGVIKNGRPSEVLDMLEAYFLVLDESKRSGCEQEVNQAFTDVQQPWRILEGRVIKLDSGFLREEALLSATSLLSDQGFEGPLQEFEQAIDLHSSAQYRNSIVSANNAVESTMKSVLNITRAKPGELIRALVDSGLVPEYYSGFLNSFETILVTVSTERNQPGRGHGQGRSVAEVDPSLAEFCLHLAGTLIVFLIKRYNEKASFVEPGVGLVETEDLPF